MTLRRLAAAAPCALFVLALASGCTGPAAEPAEAARADVSAAATPATDHATQAPGLNDGNLAAYARALEKQAEIIRRPGRGTHYGVSISVHGGDGESGEVLEAAGMTAPEYQAVHQMVHPVFTTLNFQGEIGPPRSIDVEAAPQWKERLESDPFDTLPPESSAALRRHMDTLVPLWSDIIGLTAQHGR